MDIHSVFRLVCLFLVAAFHIGGITGENACSNSHFFNKDLGDCVPCSTCIQFPKTPSCDKCPRAEPPDSWRVVAITSSSVLAAVVFFGALIIGLLVHQRKSIRTLSEPIEETTGPLYPV